MNLAQYLETGGYVGRGIFIGLSHDEKSAIQIYWIEARKMGHRSRKFVLDEKSQSIQVRCLGLSNADELSDLEYTAMLSCGTQHIVSNGPQTELLADHCAYGGDLLSCVVPVTRAAPPEDIHSPRITAVTDLSETSPKHLLCVITPPGRVCDESVYMYRCGEIPAGSGYCVTTYSGMTSKPVSFSGHPHLLAICKSTDRLEDELWASIPFHLRVGIAIKEIDLDTGMTSVRWRSRVC